ncbi:MAG TPA: DUF6232 family protein [Terriglobales bacterium]|nr:DUF6232 family protein [Terriglobales bacterium]
MQAGIGAAPAPAREAEKTFYQGNGVTVTSTRFIVPGQTYAMASVTSVRFERIPPKRGAPILITIIGFLVLMFPEGRWFGVTLLVFGILWLLLLKTNCAVALSSASGEVRAIKSTDSDFITGIVDALNDAIVYRR